MVNIARVSLLFVVALLLLKSSVNADIRAWQLGSQCIEIPMTENIHGRNIHEIGNELIIPPGQYTYKNHLFTLDSGMVRICNIPNENINRIIWNGDLYAFLSGLTWVHSHGPRDDGKTIQESINICKRDKLIKTCGGISIFTKTLLDSLGIPTRLVLFLTLQPWNNYDNGHTCIEVFWEGKWRLIDIDLKQTINVKNEPIRAIDFPETIRSGNYKIKKLSDAPVLSGISNPNAYNYALFAEAILSSEEKIKVWYSRVGDVVLIYNSGYWWFHHSQKDKVLKYSPAFRYLEKNEFESKFYH